LELAPKTRRNSFYPAVKSMKVPYQDPLNLKSLRKKQSSKNSKKKNRQKSNDCSKKMRMKRRSYGRNMLLLF
jgi:hypothetical protein